MRKIAFPILLAGFLLAAIFGLTRIALGQTSGDAGDVELVRSEKQEDNLREIYAPAGSVVSEQPEISFIDSPTVMCAQPDPAQDACYINWYYMSVNASPNYMIAMTVTLNATGPVAKVGGFFQTSMYVPYNMMGDGFKVACGELNAGGHPMLGNAYAWTISARDSSNLKSANYGTAYCPAYIP